MKPIWLLILLLFPAAVASQETSGDVRGRLRSTDGRVVAGATLVASSPSLLGTRRVTSSSDGVFQFAALPPGIYNIRVTAIGHRPTVIDSVHVQLGRIQGLPDTQLEATSVQLSEVRIAAPRVTLDPARTTIGATLEASDYAALPADRDYKSLMAILPHANTSYHGDPVNVGGATGLENMYFIDGVNVTTPWKATGGTGLPYNFVRAVEVRAGGYEAQYGRALGGIVNAITHTGTNSFEWSGFGFFTNDELTAQPRAQPVLRETGIHSYDAGALVSGPVMRDRVWFSAAYNPRVSGSNRQVGDLGVYKDRARADIFAGKLTWQAGRDATIEVSVFGDPSTRHEVAPPPIVSTYTPLNPDLYLRRVERGGVSTAVRLTTMIGPALLEASAGRSRSVENTRGDTERARSESPLIDHLNGTVSGGLILPGEAKQGINSVMLRSTISLSRHRLVVGAEMEDAHVDRAAFPGVDSTVFVRHADGRYEKLIEGGAGPFHNKAPAAYVQDAWRVSDHLTVNAGLRWSRQVLTGTSGRTAQRFDHQWQPRAGFSLQLHRSGASRTFGSYGRFYQQIPLNLSSLYYLDYAYKSFYFETDPREAGAVAVDSLDFSSTEADFAGMADGATPERFDEFTLGYEHLLGTTRLTLRAMRRHLGTAFQHGIDFSRGLGFFLGTPGKGELFFLPPPRRDYQAFEIGVDGSWGDLGWRASYVASRSYGNFVGLYGSDIQFANPGNNYGLSFADQGQNSTGLLPNHRPHVFKVSGAWRAPAGVNVGMILTWQSGTPLNVFGYTDGGSFFPKFLKPRGSIGRLPSIRDLNLRLSRDVSLTSRGQGRVVFDLQHVGNPQTAVEVDQFREIGRSASGSLPRLNPNYLRPIAFAPPASVRLGLELRSLARRD